MGKRPEVRSRRRGRRASLRCARLNICRPPPRSCSSCPFRLATHCEAVPRSLGKLRIPLDSSHREDHRGRHRLARTMTTAARAATTATATHVLASTARRWLRSSRWSVLLFRECDLAAKNAERTFENCPVWKRSSRRLAQIAEQNRKSGNEGRNARIPIPIPCARSIAPVSRVSRRSAVPVITT